MNTKKTLLISIVVLALGICVGCGKKADDSAATTATAGAAAPAATTGK